MQELALAFLSVCVNSCAYVSQCLNGLLCLSLRFSVFVWTLVLAFLSVCMDSCANLSQCLCGLCTCACVFSVCMDSCACTCVVGENQAL